MENIIPEPFTFRGGEKAVLLLHGFTGNSSDVRMMGRYLQNNGYTCHAPQYTGHGDNPEALASSTLEDWWQDVLHGYQRLVEMGHNEIAVIGISLGGVFSLKLAMEKPVMAVVSMCAPMGFIDDTILKEMVISYARKYKKLEDKSSKEIEQEVLSLIEHPINAVNSVFDIISDVKENLQKIDAPILVIQGRQDKVIELNSPEIIHQNVRSEEKKILWYENSGHIITLDKERNQLEEDVFNFLNGLLWDEHSDFIFDIQEIESTKGAQT